MLKKNLEQREKSELIAIIQQMLSQEPELHSKRYEALLAALERGR